MRGGKVALAATDVIGAGPLASVSFQGENALAIEEQLKESGFVPVWRGRSDGDPSWRGLFVRDWTTVAQDFAEQEAAVSLEAMRCRRSEADATEALRSEIGELKQEIRLVQAAIAEVLPLNLDRGVS